MPFGFAFSGRGDVVVSEASASTVSSYRLGIGGLRLISASVPTLQGAACWIAVTPDGRFAYSGNAATGSITGFALGRDGSLTRLAADGRSADAPARTTSRSPTAATCTPSTRTPARSPPTACAPTAGSTRCPGRAACRPASPGSPRADRDVAGAFGAPATTLSSV